MCNNFVLNSKIKTSLATLNLLTKVLHTDIELSTDRKKSEYSCGLVWVSNEEQYLKRVNKLNLKKSLCSKLFYVFWLSNTLLVFDQWSVMHFYAISAVYNHSTNGLLVSLNVANDESYFIIRLHNCITSLLISHVTETTQEKIRSLDILSQPISWSKFYPQIVSGIYSDIYSKCLYKVQSRVLLSNR